MPFETYSCRERDGTKCELGVYKRDENGKIKFGRNWYSNIGLDRPDALYGLRKHIPDSFDGYWEDGWCAVSWTDSAVLCLFESGREPGL